MRDRHLGMQRPQRKQAVIALLQEFSVWGLGLELTVLITSNLAAP